MLLEEKFIMIRKLNNLSQEAFAEELGVSRQAVSKWENGASIPDITMLTRIADYYNLTLDQLVRDEFDLSQSEILHEELSKAQDVTHNLGDYLGYVCDVSMNSFRYSVIRNAHIVGQFKNLVCFVKNRRFGYFNIDKSEGILTKEKRDFQPINELALGKCTVYVNKGTYFGGQTFLFSKLVQFDEHFLEIHTGEFVSKVSWDDISVIMMSEKVEG